MIINESWGEVDWLLPILFHIKKEYRAKIWAYFTSNAIFQERADYIDLDRMLESICQQVVTPETLGASDNIESISKPKIADIGRLREITGDSVDLIFHELGGENFGGILNLFSRAQTVAFPHGTFIFNWVGPDLRDSYRRSMHFEAMRRDTVLLVGSELDREYFAALTELRRIDVVGHPKLDRSWIKEVISRGLDSGDLHEALAGNGHILFLQYPGRRFSSRKKYADFNRTVFMQSRRRGLPMLIRRHPRQDRTELEEYAELFSESAIKLSKHSVLASAQNAAVAICYPTSGCMDAIAAGIPVIEFFDYKGEHWPTFVPTSEGYTSIYRRAGLVRSVDSREQLEAEIDRLVDDPIYRKKIITEQYQSLTRLIPMPGLSAQACARLCD